MSLDETLSHLPVMTIVKGTAERLETIASTHEAVKESDFKKPERIQVTPIVTAGISRPFLGYTLWVVEWVTNRNKKGFLRGEF